MIFIVRIVHKLDSVRLIKKLKLNMFPEEVFRTGEDNRVLAFMDQYPVFYYAIRSKEIVGCRNNDFKVSRDRVLEKIKLFSLYSINVSSYNYVDHFVFIGDVRFGRDNSVWLIGSKNANYTGRMAERDPDFNFKTNIFDKRFDLVPVFDRIYRYVVEHSLLDIIVELAVYDIKVGIYQEEVVIFEIRTDF